MNKISSITRQDILDIIKDGFVIEFDEPVQDWNSGEYITDRKVFMPFYGRLDEIKFLDRVYNLKSLESYDYRYENAYDDICCHTRFGDFEDDFWFFDDDRFKLQDDNGDEPILKFVCEMLHPAVRKEKDPWKQYLDKFNELLRPDGYELYPAQRISGRDVYSYREYMHKVESLLPEQLFSERYKEYISIDETGSVDRISNIVDYNSKKKLCKIMLEFNEPRQYRVSRYSSDTRELGAFIAAIERFNNYKEMQAFDLRMAWISPSPVEDLIADYFTPYIFDVIEFQYAELSPKEKDAFQESINNVFHNQNISFRLTDRGIIEQMADCEVLSLDIINSVNCTPEQGLKDLINIAIEKHMQPDAQSHKDAVEKMWDAFERLKTFYKDLDKKHSARIIVHEMCEENSELFELLEKEFIELTTIGNEYRIRHHEVDKKEITSIRHYDYLFNRCLSLVSLAIQYLR